MDRAGTVEEAESSKSRRGGKRLSAANLPTVLQRRLRSSERARSLLPLLATAERLLNARDPETIARVVVDAARVVTGASSGHMTVVDGSGSSHRLLHSDPVEGEDAVSPTAHDRGHELWLEASRSGEAVVDNASSTTGAVLHNVMVVPLINSGVTLGAMGLTNKARNFDEHDRRATMVLAGLAAMALQSLRAEGERRRADARIAQAGVLAAGMAHELNNPLSYVLFNLESLVEDMPRLLRFTSHLQALVADRLGHEALTDPELVEASRQVDPTTLTDIEHRLRDALDGAQRIKEISRGIATFARVETDEVMPVRVEEVIDVAATAAQNEIKYRAQLVRDYGDTPAIAVSEGRLAEVFLNLIINSTQAIEDGDADANWIKLRTWMEHGQVCAEVRDSGAGIPPTHLETLFDPFFTTKDVGAGSGLGLSISKNIIEGYGGSIEVQSTLGEGTSFVVRLPTAATHSISKGAAGDQATTPNAPRGRILVVDDEPGVRAGIARALSRHQLVLAASGREALRILENDRAFDIILCDVMMPAVSGIDVHRWLLEHFPRLAAVVVFISGGAFTPRVRQYLAGVDNPCLDKPLETQDLRAIVREYVGDRLQEDPGRRTQR